MVLTAILGAVAVAVVGYYLLFAVVHLLIIGVGAVEFRRRSGAPPRTDRPPITVAVPAYNERGTVVNAVSALLDQDYPVSVGSYSAVDYLR